MLAADQRLGTRWRFTSRDTSPIIWTLPVDGRRLLVADAAGRVTSLDAASGKVLWERSPDLPRNATPPADPNNSRYAYGGYRTHHLQGVERSAAPLVDDAGRVVLATAGSVVCLDAESGFVRWIAAIPMPAGAAAGGDLQPSLWLDGERVGVLQPDPLRFLWFDRATGRLVATRDLADEFEDAPPRNPAMQPGVAMSEHGVSRGGDGRLFVWSDAAAVTDAAGEPIWQFTPNAEAAFPLILREPSIETPAAPPTAANMAAGWSGVSPHYASHLSRRSYGYGGPVTASHLSYLGPPQPQFHQQLQHGGGTISLASPAVAWVTTPPPKFARLVGNRLVLMSAAGVSVVRLDLPFTAQPVPNLYPQHTLIAGQGDTLVFLQRFSMMLLDVNDLSIRNVSLLDGNNAEAMQWAQSQERWDLVSDAVMDGPVVYASSPQGVTIANGRTGTVLRRLAWDEMIGPFIEASGEGEAESVNQQQPSGAARSRKMTVHSVNHNNQQPPRYGGQHTWRGRMDFDTQGRSPASSRRWRG